jgi:predicted transcriptional regulator
MAKAIQRKIRTERIQARSEPGRCRGPQDLSRLELECMKAIWLEGAVTVLQVQTSLKEKRPLAYTTILTVLDRLAKKGALHRVKKGRAYYYEPALSFVESRDIAVAQLIDFYFQGSIDRLLHYLSGLAHSPAVRSQSRSHSVRSPEMVECLL